MKKKTKMIWRFFLLSGVIFMMSVVLGHNYQFTEENVVIKSKNNDLATIITVPKNKKIKGTIFFVHGDGAQNATQDGGYKPIMNAMAKQGFASVSWDKPGVGKSTGKWLTQTMEDRADEASDVINWVKKKRPDLDGKIGLWGASQAGWVIPKIDVKRKDIDFSLLLAPGVNWLEQSECFTVQEAKSNGKSPSEIRKIKTDFRKQSQTILNEKDNAAYLKKGGTFEMSNDRFVFVKQNMSSDATEDLSKMTSRVYLCLGLRDENIDPVDTEEKYREFVKPKLLKVKTIPEGEHTMINPNLLHSKFKLTMAALFYPKDTLIRSDYLEEIESVLGQQ